MSYSPFDEGFKVGDNVKYGKKDAVIYGKMIVNGGDYRTEYYDIRLLDTREILVDIHESELKG